MLQNEGSSLPAGPQGLLPNLKGSNILGNQSHQCVFVQGPVGGKPPGFTLRVVGVVHHAIWAFAFTKNMVNACLFAVDNYYIFMWMKYNVMFIIYAHARYYKV